MAGYHQLQHGVSQELQPLVVDDAVLVGIGAMGESGQQQIPAAEAVAQTFLQTAYRQWNLSSIRSGSRRSEPS